MPDLELRKCPFCGYEAKAMKWSVTYEVEIQCTNEDCDAFQNGIVTCEDGESEESAYNRAYEIAKEKWNRRTGEEDKHETGRC